MLEHVAANQTRFVAPGLAPDARGVALGRYVMVLLPSIDRVVGLFRGLSEKMSLDELLPALRIVQVRTPLSSRELLVQLPVGSSFAADSVAAVAALIGGMTFTGSAKHFVKYRDTRSPLGYDVDTLHAGAGDVVLYASDFVQVYGEERALDFARMTQTLSLTQERSDALAPSETALLRVVRGLFRPVLTYLHRNGVRCAAAAAEIPLGPGRDLERVFLLRCEDLPERMAQLFSSTPGVEVLRVKVDNVAVELGYRHPFELTSCSSVFDDEQFYLYSGAQDRLDILSRPPQFVDANTLVELGPLSEIVRAEASPAAAEDVKVPLRLVPVSGAQPPLVASRIPATEGERLKRLIYLLPPPVLARYGICVTDDFIYLLAETGVDFVPLGEMFWALAPGVFIPQGLSLLPRVAPDVLREHLGAIANQLFFFRRDEPEPLRFNRADFAPLGRHSLAQVVVREGSTTLLPAAPEIESLALLNDEIGLFPLWRFDGALPAEADDEQRLLTSAGEGEPPGVE
ncbi:MAG: hypothetical protein CSA65_00280 [Proteobacteria bacterium]|nr:MAG: hypothetical protein CSB49_06825 [Pseudomonadota bacterium]PIE19919.1 MAG: hypothetical protein CSA65_00280 [Pseudomonadota bacterium]